MSENRPDRDRPELDASDHDERSDEMRKADRANGEPDAPSGGPQEGDRRSKSDGGSSEV